MIKVTGLQRDVTDERKWQNNRMRKKKEIESGNRGTGMLI